jgi:hypothetical protein
LGARELRRISEKETPADESFGVKDRPMSMIDEIIRAVVLFKDRVLSMPRLSRIESNLVHKMK